MKILLISLTNNIQSGGGNLTHELCMFLKGKVDFTLLLPWDEKRYDYTSYPVEYILPSYIFDTRNFTIFKYLFFKYKTDADIIHSIFEFPYALIADRISRKNNIPLIIGLAGTYAVKPLFVFPDNLLLKRAYNHAKSMIAISKFTADSVAKYSKTKTPIDIIHCAVNFERFSREYFIEDIKKKYAGKKLLMTVGALKPRKGHDIVLKALAILKKERNDFHYIISGNNEKRNTYADELNEIIKSGNLEENITFAGSISDEDLPRYFSAIDIYIHTPIMVNWNFEGFGIVYLEAGSARKPVIASNSGGTLDAVISDKTGLVVPEGDINSTYYAIKKLLDNEQLRKSLGDAGFEYAKEHSWERIGEKFIDIYKKFYKSNQ
mgnify:FL=1